MEAPMRRFLATNDSWIPFLQRAALAAVVLGHGLQKLFGWFGGYGWNGTMQFFTQGLHVPALFGALVILSDSLGALALLFGAFTRLCAAGVAATMVGAVLLVHAPNGFFMNWSGAQAGEGFEFHLLALALALPLIATGAGRWSIDGILARTRPAPLRIGAPAGA
jgi:putative oxidoreductase